MLPNRSHIISFGGVYSYAMKTLIAVKSCKHHQMAGYHDAILDTWGNSLPPNVDLRFFTGQVLQEWTLNPRPCEIDVDVPDDYMSLPLKTKAICRWSINHDYDFTFLCDTDTFLIPSRLLRSGYADWDYCGRFGTVHPVGTTFAYTDAHLSLSECHPWASGGVGYFLSKKASILLSQDTPSYWAEDLWVGQCLGPHIQAGNIKAADLLIECDSAWHFPRRKYRTPYNLATKWMETMYADHH
jgi:hypothetical protein